MKQTGKARVRAIHAGVGVALLVSVAGLPSAAWADRRSESVTSYERASARFEGGDYKGARIELMKALQANPNNPLARLLNARVALEVGAGVAAQTEIEKARKAGVPVEKTRHLMAHALFLQGKGAAALKEADPARVPPQFAAYAARIRGRAQMLLEQPERARGEFELAQRLSPNNVDVLADRARYEMLSGRQVDAEKIVDRALALEPKSAKVLVLKGNLVRSRLGLAKSLPYFTQAIQSDPDNVEALLERAGTYGDLRREAEARADLKKVQALAPDHPLALYLTAVLEARAGRYSQANALMTRTKGQLDRYAPALMLQGMLAYQLNDLKAADGFLSRALAKAPNYAIGRKLLASTQMRQGEYDEAIRTLQPLANAPNADGGTLALMGQALARKGDFKAAQTYLQRASRAAPGATELQTQLAMTQAALGENAAASATIGQVLKTNANQPQALMAAALVNLRSNKYREALATTNRLVAVQPNAPVGYNMRGAALLGLGDRKAAEANFRTALQKDPKFTEARRNLAQVLIATGRRAEAKRELQTMVDNDAKDVRAMMALASLAETGGNQKERLQWLQQATAADPNAMAPRMALTQAYVQTGQANRAITEARALERDFPNEPAAVELVGMANLAARKPADAESAFNRLTAMAPGAVGPRLMLARTQATQGRLAVARQTYEQALLMPGQNVIPVYVDFIRMEQRAGRTAEASRLVERMRKAYPKSNVPDQIVGDMHMQAGRVAQAIASYEVARRIAFDRTVATRLSVAHQRAGRPQAAIQTLQAYAKGKPRDPLIEAAVAEIQIGLRQYRPAIATYESLMKRGGGNSPAVLNNLAWAYHQVGDKRALGIAERAYKLQPNAAAVKDTLGVILVDTRKDPKRGLALLQQAVKASPRDPNLRFHAAVGYVANGRKQDALRELNLALKAARFDSRAKAVALRNRLIKA